ncbi:Alpha/Beta hydrolase protein [Lineolata rhizophorae]|uniref:Alpha/Beta hydrolase protein n=1 Tax=Lineolata rhizophorae TaxID=578093 RepID=A0A6A6NLG1_9PEZI|nr:Alpha/Beta hydrolase protein [Lineolata rhizophorae]
MEDEVSVRIPPPACFRPAQLRTASSSTKPLDLAFDLHEPPPDRKRGDGSGPIVFLHGLFGSKKNNRTMSKVLARDLGRPVYAVDLRNHGDSPHDPLHNYTALALDVENFLRTHSLRSSTLIGHSMGAKAAMTVALRSALPSSSSYSPSPSSSSASSEDAGPSVAALVAIDNAPVDAALKSDFAQYVRGMRLVEDARVTRQKDADALLAPYAPQLPVRQFLLTNLVRPRGAPPDAPLKFRIPVRTLAAALDDMSDFPFKDPSEARWVGPALFVRGTKSHYVADDVLPVVGEFFPRFELADVESGHWVVSENPEGFRSGEF